MGEIGYRFGSNVCDGIYAVGIAPAFCATDDGASTLGASIMILAALALLIGGFNLFKRRVF